MRALALLGARARIAELDAERDRIVAMFPELGKRTRAVPVKGPAVLFDAGDDETNVDALAPARAAADPDRTQTQAVAMFKNGKPVEKIAAELGLSINWVYRMLRNARLDGTLAKRATRFEGKPPRASETKIGGKQKRKPDPREATGKPQTGKHKQWRARRFFDDKFKEAAVARIKSGEYLTDVSRDLDIVPSVIERWCKAAKVKIPKMSNAERQRRNGEAQKTAYTTEQRETALARVAAGEAARAVARDMNIPEPTVRGWTLGKGAERYKPQSDGE